MRKYLKGSLTVIALSVLVACGGNNSSGTTSVTETITFTQLTETLEFPIGEVIDGVQQATGIGNDAGLLYILTNNQRVHVFTEDAELVEQFEIPTLGTVSAQALSAQNEQVAVLDSQGQLYLKRSGEQAVEVISYNYPEPQEFAALAYGENGDWLTVNRSNAKTLYTLENDGDISGMALDSRLSDFNIVGADADDGRLFLLANRFQQERSASIFEIGITGQVTQAWSFAIEDGLTPDGLNVADPTTGEFVVAYSDPLATVKVFEMQ